MLYGLRRLSPIAYPVLTAILFTALPSTQAQIVSEPSRFTIESMFIGKGVTAAAFDFAGRVYLAEKQGRLLVSERSGDRYVTPTLVADWRTEVDATAEAGLLGLALDPDFRNNRHVYVLHTTTQDQRIVRHQLSADFLSVVSGSSQVVFSGLPREAEYHKAGDLHIRPSEPDYLYLSTGDDGNMDFAQDLNRYNGKILKIRKSDGRGAPGNPYYADSGTSVRSRIWASGFRNPFRFVFHPLRDDVIFVSENGGPVNQRTREDRVTWVKQGADCGWSEESVNGGATSTWFAPTDTKCKTLITDPPSLVGIAIARGGGLGDPNDPLRGVLYVANLYYPTGANQSSVRRWKLTGADWDGVEAFAADTNTRFAQGFSGVDLNMGPDGNLYATNTMGGLSQENWYGFERIRSTSGPVDLVRKEKGQLGGQLQPSASRRIIRGWRVGNLPVTVSGRSLSNPSVRLEADR